MLGSSKNRVLWCLILTIMLISGMFTLSSAAEEGVVVTYPNLYYNITSPVFRIEANGESVPTSHFINYHYAHFSFEGRVTVKITASEAVDTFNISPHSLKIAGRKDGNTLSFDIKTELLTQNYFVIQINKLERLVVLADPLEKDVPPSSGAGIFNIAEAPYNADPTDKEDATAIIQKAIDDAGNAGGGVVYVPVGVYKVLDTIMVDKDNVTLYLEGGSALRASADINEYVDKKHLLHPFKFSKASNSGIRGRGTIDASGYFIMDKFIDPETGNYGNRRRLIEVRDCNNFNMEGVIARDSTSWAITVYTTEYALIENVKLLDYVLEAETAEGYKIQNDGIDITSSRHARVNKCFIFTIDDAFCAKSTNKNYHMYDVIFSNNIVYTFCAGHKAGIQSQSEMYDIWFVNNDIIYCRRGIVAEATDGATIFNNIHYVDIRVEHQVPLGRGLAYNIDVIARTNSQFNIEITRVNFEELHDSQFEVRVPNVIENFVINDTYAAGKKIGDIAQFTNMRGDDLSGVSFGSGGTVPVLYFSDIDGHWGKREIEEMAIKGIVKGTEAEKFSPDKNIKRADFILLLMRALGINADNNVGSQFTDVTQADYFAREISKAGAAGIIDINGTEFKPNEAILRKDMAAFTENAAKAVGLTISDKLWDGENPSATATRAEAVTIISRIYGEYMEQQLIEAVKKAKALTEVEIPIVDMEAKPAESGFSTTAEMFVKSGLASATGGQSYICRVEGEAIWNPDIKEACEVEVFVWKLRHSNSEKQSYNVYFDGKMATIPVDFTLGTSEWVSIGTYEFSGSGKEYVKFEMSDELEQRIGEVKFEIKSGSNAGEEILVEQSAPNE